MKKPIILDYKKEKTFIIYANGTKKILDVQRNTLNNLSKFAERIYNLCLMKYR